MDKTKKSPDKSRHFRVIHQVVAITHIDFINKCIIGFTELQIRLLKQDKKVLHLNSKQCKIFRVTVNNDFDAEFSLLDPTLDICQVETKKRNLDYFSNCHSNVVKAVDADHGGGELRITLPSHYTPSFSISSSIPNTRSHGNDIITIGIEFALENPESGVHFVVPPFYVDKKPAERGCYLITGGHPGSSRLWFPCVDSYSELCTWKLEFTVDKDMTAVSCGDFIDAPFTPDFTQKTFNYEMNVPVCAPHIALAVGPFEMLTDPNMNEMVHFCLPKLLPLMRHATSFLHQAFEFCEEYLTCRYPYTIYKQVFVDETFSDLSCFATMSIINCSYLFPKTVIEQNIPSRSIMALGACAQFFGYYLTPNSWDDMWIAHGASRYLHGLFYKKYFGNNEHRFQVYQQMKEVTKFEHERHPIVLVPPKQTGYVNANFHFSPLFPQTCSEEYSRLCAVKSYLVIRMLEERIGPQMLAQVFNKMLALAANAAVSKESEAWNGLLLSTGEFVKGINTVTTKDIQPFIDKWVYTGDHVRLKGRFVFNRKRNMVEMELGQDNVKGCATYAGPLPLYMQELDGSTKHVIQIEENSNKHDVPCHSKTRRHKKKKIPVWTGDEIDIDLHDIADAYADCPVLWIRFDPDMTLIRTITFEEPDFHLQFLVRYERDVVAQMAALEAVEAFPSIATKVALTAVVENERCFYRLRLAAAETLTRLSNHLALSGGQWSSPSPMYALYKKLFFVRLPSTAVAGAPIVSNIVKRNDFHDFVQYFLQKTLPVCMARLRNTNNVCPSDVVTMLIDMWKYNENRRNFYSDSYYRAALIEAFGDTFTESAGTLAVSEDPKVQFEQLSTVSKQCMENIFRPLNEEKYLPSYQYVVTVSCLNTFRKMQKHGILPAEWCLKIYKDYTNPKLYRNVRVVGFAHLVEHLQATAKVNPSHDLLDYLLTVAASDADPYIRHIILRKLIEKPPFTKEAAKPDESPLSSEALVDRLWKWMNFDAGHDARLRCDLVDLYYTLYGRRRPACVPIPDLGMVLNLKENKALLSVAAMASLEEKDTSQAASGVEPIVENPPPVVVKTEQPEEAAPATLGQEVVAEERMDITPQLASPLSPLVTKLKIKIGEPSRSVTPVAQAPAPQLKENPEQHKKKKKKHKHKKDDREGGPEGNLERNSEDQHKRKKKKHKHKKDDREGGPKEG